MPDNSQNVYKLKPDNQSDLNMDNYTTVKEFVESIMDTSNFAVLATEGNGQPHVSLITITPFGNFRQIIFATYRNTLKYRNLTHNNKVAILIESGAGNLKGLTQRVVITIIGYTEVIRTTETEAAYKAHLKRHPEMESFMLSPDCALIKFIAQSYQIVNGIDDIRWITADNLDAL